MATQCEPFDIFYNSTVDGYSFFFQDITYSHTLFTITVPKGIGYLEWICNIPASIAFDVFPPLFDYTVHAGSSSACLVNITTTYSHLYYATTVFASYTRTASPLVTSLPTIALPTATFPTGTFSTITLNPILAVIPTTSPPSSSSPVTSSISSPPSPTVSSPSTSSPTPSHKSRNAAVAGGVVGAGAFVLLILTLVLWWRRRSSLQARTSSPIDPQPASISGLATGELDSMDLSSPYEFSGAKFLRGARQYQFSPPDPCSHRTEPSSDNPIVVQMTGTPEAHVCPIVGQGTHLSRCLMIQPLRHALATTTAKKN